NFMFTQINNQRYRIVRVVDAVQFVDAAREKTDMLWHQPLALAGVDKDCVRLSIDKPNSFDAWLEQKAENGDRLRRQRIPRTPSPELPSQETDGLAYRFVLPAVLIEVKLSDDEALRGVPLNDRGHSGPNRTVR